MKQIVVKTSVAVLVFLGLFTSCTITMTTSKAVGEQIKLKMNANEDQKKNVWIDLNNNGKKDSGEVVTKFDEYVDYTIGSQTIDLHGGIKSLDCKKNELTSLVSKNAALEDLICSANQITTLDVSTSTELKRLFCDANRLKVLDVTKNTKLKYLNCRYNQLAVLDISKNTPLESLDCDGNQLAALDMSKNKELRGVHCVNNKLKALDISNNKQLRYFTCSDNQLTKFDISRNMQLKYLGCAGNKLTTLDASHSKALQFLICNNNTKLTKLNVANGNNRNFSQPWSDAPTFNARNCPKLSCIKVDKNFNPNKQTSKGKKWVKDASAIYRNDGSECGNTPPPSTISKIIMTTTKAIGEKIKLYIKAVPADQPDVWIDLNNNGKKDSSESVTNFWNDEEYELKSQTITIYGKVTNLRCPKNELIQLDLTANKQLEQLYCSQNQLTELNVSANKQLSHLGCTYNPLKQLNVTANERLEALWCYGTQLTKLNVTANKQLEGLYCSHNQLTQLDVSANKQLNHLNCSHNQLTRLNVLVNKKLSYLDCSYNQLTQLNISENTQLNHFVCYRNLQLTKLNIANGNNNNFAYPWYGNYPAFDATNCPQLTCIKVDKGFDPTGLTGKKEWRKDATAVWNNSGNPCEGTPTVTAKITMSTTKTVGEKIKLRTYAEVANQSGVWIDLNNNGKKDNGESVTNFWNDEEYELKSQTITIYGKVTNLDCSKNKLTQLDVSKNTELEELYSQDNNLTSLDIRKNIKLTSLDCSSNRLTELDVRNCRKLVYLYCYVNQLTKLNVSNCTKLEGLQCYRNKLTELDVRKCRELKWLNFTNNQLKTTDLSECKELYELYCSMNKLITLDVSGNTQLKQLLCTNNQLTVLDVSGNKSLRKFWCSNNHNLTSVNVANGHNRDFDGKYHTNPAFDAIGCSKLKCIKVDKGFDPTGLTGKKEWRKDATAVWNNSGNPCGDYTPSDNPKITFTTTKAIGEKIRLWINTAPADQANVWIDLNNNGAKDRGEAVTTFCSYIEYTLGAQTVTLYGKVTELSCGENQLTQLDVTKNAQLTKLGCYKNKLIALDVSKNTQLTKLECGSNDLTTLDVSVNTQLELLSCGFNKLTTLDVSKNTQLEFLYCHYNDLTKLNVSNTVLIKLYCNSNELKALYLSENAELKVLNCSSNDLITLDVSANKQLINLNCKDNSQLTKVNVANGNNKNFKFSGSGDRPAFNATGCSALTCIKVDNGFNPAGQTGTGKKWKKDSGASYINDGSNCN